MAYQAHGSLGAYLNGVRRAVKEVWVYSDGTFVTANGVLLSAGWHRSYYGYCSATYPDWDPANGPMPRDPPPPNVTQTIMAYDFRVPTVAPAGVSIAATDFSTINPNPVTAKASWGTASGEVSSWKMIVEFWSEAGGLLETKEVNITPRTVESSAVYTKNDVVYARLRYKTDGGTGPTAETSHLNYPGSTG